MSKPIIKANLKGSDKIELVYNDRAVEMTITDFFTNLPSNTLVISNTPAAGTSGIYSGSGYLPANITVNGLAGYSIHFQAIDDFRVFANRFMLENSSNNNAIIDPTGLTDDRTYTFPDYSGEIMVNNGVKVYKALLYQAGTNAPTAIVKVNELGVTVTFSYIGVGEYFITAVGKMNPKPFIKLELPTAWGTWNHTIQDNDTTYLQIFDTAGTPLNSLLNWVPFEIEVYP